MGPSLRIKVEATIGVTGVPSFLAGDSDGVFARWAWDGSVLTARNCRFGFHPLFYRQYDNGIAVATSIGALMDPAEQPALDYDALAVFLQIGFYLAEDTPFRDIRALPPHSTLTWSRDRDLRIRRAPLPNPRPLTIGRARAVGEYARLFTRAVESSLARVAGADRVYVPLSGGEDSRHIAFALFASGHPPRAFVTLDPFPGNSMVDSTIAPLVAERLGIDIVRLQQPINIAPNFVRTLRETGYCCDEHAWFIPLADWSKANADVLFDGIAGDVMSAALYSAPSFEISEHYRRGELRTAAQVLMQMWGGNVLRLVPEPLRELVAPERAMRRILEELETFSAHANPVRDFFFWNRTRREIALVPFALYVPCRVATPFLEPELWDFLAALPYDVTADRRFHAQTIAAAYPPHSDIPYAEHNGNRRPWPRIDQMLSLGGFAWHLFRRSPTVRPDALRRIQQTLSFIQNRLNRGAHFATARALVVAELLSSPAQTSLSRTTDATSAELSP